MSNLPVNWLEKYLRLTNYLGASQLYLKDNFLLEEELKPEHIKDRILGHWGTVPGLNLILASFNYLIKKYNQNMLSVVGPGHGYPALQANLFVEGSLGELYDKYEIVHKSPKERKEAWGRLIRDFSWPGGFPSHANPKTPGCILEGGELGYSLSTAFGAAFDNPDLIVGCIVGDGEAETGPIATAWHSNKFLNPITSGAVLPIVHLNGYKISGPTIYGVMDNVDLISLFKGYGWDPILVDEEDLFEPTLVAMDTAYRKIKSIQDEARSTGKFEKPRWPMIILKSPKGWYGPKSLDKDKPIVGSFRSHGIPLEHPKINSEEFALLKDWLESYKVGELINDDYSIKDELLEFVPRGSKRMGMNRESRADDTKDLVLPDPKDYQIEFDVRGSVRASSMELFSQYVRDIFKLNAHNNNFRLFCPDETESNKMHAIFEETNRAMMWPHQSHDENISKDGRVMEMLSEHTLEGWLQGYVLTGRHGVFVSYEAFMEIVSSMIDQYIKFLKHSRNVSWRQLPPSLNFVLTSLSWRQDHNGFSHQNPGFISSMLENESDFVSVYFPSDANSMLSVAKEVFGSRGKVNIIVAGKRDIPLWLKPDEAQDQVDEDIKIWDFVSDDDPDVVLVATGDYLMKEVMAARKVLKNLVPEIKLRIVNVSELTTFNLGDNRYKNSKVNDLVFDEIFTTNRPVIYNYHGYSSDIAHLMFNHPQAPRFSLHGYKEKGTTTTPYDMLVESGVDRYSIAIEAIRFAAVHNVSVSKKQRKLLKYLEGVLKKHKLHIVEFGTDIEEVREFDFES